MTAYTRAMSTTETERPAAPAADGRPTETAVIPAVPVRGPILHRAGTDLAADRAATSFDGWRGRAVTEALAAVPAARRPPRQARRRCVARRHLRCALVGTLLAVVAVTGLSSYAAAGVTDARSTSPCQAHVSRR